MLYGFEAFLDGQWSREAVGIQDRSNLFETRAEAEAELPRLARKLGCSPEELRVVEFDDGPPEGPDEAGLIMVGDWVVAGHGDDLDIGRIVGLVGNMATVAWDTGVRTVCDISCGDVEVFGSRASAEACYEERRAAE